MAYLGVRQVECTLLTSSIAFFQVAVDLNHCEFIKKFLLHYLWIFSFQFYNSFPIGNLQFIILASHNWILIQTNRFWSAFFSRICIPSQFKWNYSEVSFVPTEAICSLMKDSSSQLFCNKYIMQFFRQFQRRFRSILHNLDTKLIICM